ncbi:MAG: signal peptidase I [Verrucomicrobia bacterium]|nr:signal peptidase I [Verrucomicrobiota bacterium]
MTMHILSRSTPYSLKKSRRTLRTAYHLFQKKRRKLSTEVCEEVRTHLLFLQTAILEKKRDVASDFARKVEALAATHLRKSAFDQIRDLVSALGFALIVAILVRQMWFEFYEIPSGSMRPTLKEQDRLSVSKTTFGINMPLKPDEIYFDPSLVQRNGIVVFTGENMDIPDVDTLYFYLFPGKKQYVKRMIGKPGDILYFYGGQIYGIDAEGKDISQELQLKELHQIDHIPFIDFDRKLLIPPTAQNGIYSPVYLFQMNEPVVKLSVNSAQQVIGDVINLPQIHDKNAPAVTEYGDLWGIKNYGMTRLLTRDQVKFFTDQDPLSLEEGLLYLEIRHHPSLSSAKLIRDEMGRQRPAIGISSSYIPLQEQHLKALFDSLYTARFEVKNGVAFRVGSQSNHSAKNIFLPKLPLVPDGVYEFYYGKAYAVKWQGITVELPKTHPLYQFDPATVQLLYNLGIEWDTRFAPQVKNQRLQPARYSYFRDGDLYLMGAPILQKEDPTLLQFIQREMEKQAASNPQSPYQPFIDSGAPESVDFIRQYGIQVPPHSYLVLGDNHAMSGDSREFGFVPETNLRGTPDLIFWPPGSRWGLPNQPAYPFFNLPRTIVWILAAICIGAGTLYWRRRNHLPLRLDTK